MHIMHKQHIHMHAIRLFLSLKKYNGNKDNSPGGINNNGIDMLQLLRERCSYLPSTLLWAKATVTSHSWVGLCSQQIAIEKQRRHTLLDSYRVKVV